jgi:hypothetical protein
MQIVTAMKVGDGRARWLYALALALAGCSPVQLGRIGPSMPLASGTPAGACERQEWLELAPARVAAMSVTFGLYPDTQKELREGLGIFRPGEDEPEELEDVWPQLQEPALQRAHEARIAPVDAAALRTTMWSVGGLVALGTGVGVAAAIGEDEPKAAVAVALTGLGLEIVGLVMALVSQPSGDAQRYAETRRELLIAGEDDLDAAVRGVSRSNFRSRARCGKRAE